MGFMGFRYVEYGSKALAVGTLGGWYRVSHDQLRALSGPALLAKNGSILNVCYILCVYTRSYVYVNNHNTLRL